MAYLPEKYYVAEKDYAGSLIARLSARQVIAAWWKWSWVRIASSVQA
jgi:hypothetical protein